MTTPKATPRHFLNLDDFDATTLRGMLNQAVELKQRLKQGDRPLLLKDKVLAMISSASRPAPASPSMSACASSGAKP